MVQRRSMKMGRSMKRSKSRGQKRSRNRRGGGFMDMIGFGSDTTVKYDQYGNLVKTEEKDTTQIVSDKFNGVLSSAESGINVATDKGSELLGNLNPFGSSSEVAPEVAPAVAPAVAPTVMEEKSNGGKRRSKSRQMRGGRYKSGSDLAFYAAPVTDARVAEPTYMMKYTGGKRRRRTCKKRRRCCKKSCKKRHRHRRS